MRVTRMNAMYTQLVHRNK